jgi:pimeloyl-ACP methyl ester carboxylesterase/DNA-binding CsgD family transcriptional regulator
VEQTIRFCGTKLGRIAYATVGDGPPLVAPSPWIGHLEATWEDPWVRHFVTALARRHTVVRYDPLGTGLSERKRPASAFTLETEVEMLEALIGTLRLDRATLLGMSSGGCIAGAYAAEDPKRVQRLVLYGSFANGSRVADPETRRTLPDLVARHWGLGSRFLASVFLPESGAEDLTRLRDFQRRAATPEMAATMLRFTYELDATDSFRRVLAPTLVLHRRGDRAVPFELGVEVASLVPDATFEPLTGATHTPWLGDTTTLLRAVANFIGLGPYTSEPPPGPPDQRVEALTPREREILVLVAEGMSDAEIAERLVISRHTVHRHVANIRRKLDQPSRAAAAAAATRLGLI